MSEVALIDASCGQTLTHEELTQQCRQFLGTTLPDNKKQLVLLIAANHLPQIVTLHALLSSHHATLLCDSTMSWAYIEKLIQLYKPDYIIAGLHYTFGALTHYQLIDHKFALQIFAHTESQSVLHKDLSLLLTTSGTTSTPKLVRLSAKNITINSRDIIRALKIVPSTRAVAHMSPAYSFGLSIITTHLAAGASLLLNSHAMTTGPFWKDIRSAQATSLSGVPWHFTLMDRLGFERLDIPSIATMTQAGGRLSQSLIEKFAAALKHRGGGFYVMYGQTEASPRMTVLPAGKIFEKKGSVGIALEHGQLSLEDNQVIYQGDNVMLGYATQAQDLSRGDDMSGRLETGDCGYLDDEGYLYLTGRQNRLAKIDGLRINLDELEALADDIGPVAAYEFNEVIYLYTEPQHNEAIRERILLKTQLPSAYLVCRTIPKMPYLANGKIDRVTLVKWHDA